MNRIVRLTESDLSRIVRRVIREQEEISGDIEMEVDDELDDVDENDANGLKRLLDKLGDNIRKFKGRNLRKLRRMLQKHSSKSPMFKNRLLQCPKY
jgi:hypothetical protein